MKGNCRPSARIGVRAAVTNRREFPRGKPAAATHARRVVLTAAAMAFWQGCGPPPRQVVTNPDPAGKVPAIEKAVSRRDLSVVPQLVKDLDDEDPAVRFYAIYALRELTGEEFGYRYFYDRDRRKPYVLRWNQWLANRQAESPAEQSPKK